MAKRELSVKITGDADGAKKAYKHAEQAADRFERSVDDGFTKSGKSADSFSGKLDGIKDSADDLGKGLAIGLGAAAGVLAAGLFVDSFGKALDKEAGTAKLGIQLGLPPEMAKEAGKIAGEVYGDAFGGSLAEVNDATASVIKNIGGLGDISRDEFKDLTKGVLTLADVFGEDLNKVTAAAGTLIKTGLAEDGADALDLLTRGLQSPANKAEDLLDTFIEYSTQFRKLGIDGPTALGLLSQGLAGGARSADLVADAFKEFSIRAIDGSTLTRDTFTALGLNADEMAAKIAAGGPIAAAGLQQTLDKLMEIEDPVARNIAGVGLFGTQWEDMGAAVNGLDLTAAKDQIGSVEGAMTNATTATDTNKAKVEEWKRSLEENITTFTAESVIPWLDTMALKLEDMGHQWDTNTGAVGRFRDGLADIGQFFTDFAEEVIDPVVGSLQSMWEWLNKIGDNQLVSFLQYAAGPATGIVSDLFGFDTGGVVPGPKGKPTLALVHGGETIFPTHKMSLSSALSGEPEKWVTDEDGSTGLQRYGKNGYDQDHWYGVTRAMDPDAYNLKAGMDFAALGWPAEDVAAIANLIASGGNAAMPSTSGVTVIVNNAGSVIAERDLVQSVRSGLMQAGRYGKASLV